MRFAEGDIGEERARLFLHPAICLARHHLRGPALGFSHRFTVAIKAMGVALDQVVVAGEPVIEALPVRCRLCGSLQVAQVPLAEHPGGKSPGLQDLGNGHFGIRQMHGCIFVSITVHAHTKGEAPCQQTGTRRRAIRSRCIVLCKPHALFCELIDMGGVNRPAETAKIRPACIIEINDNDIGQRRMHLDAKPCENHRRAHTDSVQSHHFCLSSIHRAILPS